MNRDLVVLCADVDIDAALRGLILRRAPALGIRPVRVDFLRSTHRDPGCYHAGPDLLEGYSADTRHALVVFDEAWEGRPGDAALMERDVESRLAKAWGDRARCLVIAPEIEAWVFSDSPKLEEVLGRSGEDLRRWLSSRGLWPEGLPKPPDPKTAFEMAMRDARRNPAAAAFGRIAETVSVDRCTDPAFGRLKSILKEWFPKE